MMRPPMNPVALNPIQWIATPDGWLDPSLWPDRAALLRRIKAAGFDAVFADPPASGSVEQYRRALDEAGLAPAPGYFSLGFSADEVDPARLVEQAKAVAGQHAALGLRDLVVASGMARDAPRVVRPARGHQADPARLARIVGLVEKVAAATLAEGVRAALHPHVGTWIESEDEARAALEAVPASALGFAPDTGHLAWAGADVPALIADYAARVSVVHVKDARRSVADQGRAQDLTYQQTVLRGLWVEPGRGDLDLPAMLDALPKPFAGWLIVEVDRPDIADPFESARASAEGMRRLLA
jgi:inosose dehydratase